MSPNKPTDIDKIKQLIATATTAKQKQMYQNLLVGAEVSLQEQERREQQENTVTEPVELAGKRTHDKSEEKKEKITTSEITEFVESEKKLSEKEEDEDSKQEFELTDNSSDSAQEEEEEDNEYNSVFTVLPNLKCKTN